MSNGARQPLTSFSVRLPQVLNGFSQRLKVRVQEDAGWHLATLGFLEQRTVTLILTGGE